MMKQRITARQILTGTIMWTPEKNRRKKKATAEQCMGQGLKTTLTLTGRETRQKIEDMVADSHQIP